MSSATARVRWLDVWTRAVILPAWKRASAVWVGTAIVGALIFGPQAMHPSDLTGLAIDHVSVALTLGATWLLVFAPTARLLIRADGARYLRSLPGPVTAPRVLAGAALLVLQLPWVLLWVIGEGAPGLVVVAGSTLAATALASWRPPVLRSSWPGWRGDGTALRAVHLRALRRRAGDALVRGAGLSILAGAAAGLFVHNNQLVGDEAATIGAAVIAVVLVPAQVGVLLVILATHKQTAWLALSLGISRATRIASVVYAIAVVELAATAIAIGAAILIGDLDAETAGWLAGVAVAVALASSFGTARVLIAAEHAETVAMRTVVGSVAVAALAVLCLGMFDILGVAALFATCLLALFLIPAGEEAR